MDVYVDRCRIHFHEKKTQRVLAAGERVSVCGAQGVTECGVLHRAAIHENQAERPIGAPAARRRYPSMNAQAAALHMCSFDQSARLIGPDQTGDSRGERGAGWQLKYNPSVAQQGETDLRMRQRLHAHRLLDVPEFRVLAAQEFPPRGHVEEKIAHFDDRARRPAPIARIPQRATVHHHFRAGQRVRFTSGQRKPGHACDTRQRLSPEPERADRRQVGGFPQLARRVALQ